MNPAPRNSVSGASPVEETVARFAGSPEFKSAVEWFRDQEPEFARWQMEVTRIPAPPFGESARAEWLAERFQALGLVKVHKDSIGNVLGSNLGSSPAVVSISAHLDTVFPANTPLNIRQQGRRLYGPGISD